MRYYSSSEWNNGMEYNKYMYIPALRLHKDITDDAELDESAASVCIQLDTTAPSQPQPPLLALNQTMNLCLLPKYTR